MITLHTYLPQDRRRALARGETLPDRTHGSALFADISGFTPLTETLTQQLGQRRGVEELTRQINAVYDALITEIETYEGSVIGFAGDAITCWFDGEGALRAVTAALAMQAAMSRFPKLGLKVAVTSGPARRFAVGDPAIQCLDALAGATIARLSTAEHQAATGEVLIDPATASALPDTASLTGWRMAGNGERFASVKQVTVVPSPLAPDATSSPEADSLRPWILPTVFAREQSGHSAFLTELRPCIALFVRFDGIDYDGETSAGVQLDAFIRLAQQTVTRFEGVLLELNIGDKGSYLYCSFGALSTHEDEARRAVKAALEIKQLVDGLAFLDTIQFGLGSGTMRVGPYGGTTRQSFGALGDDVNLAARLMMTAAPGEILISGRVRKAVAEEFMVEARPNMTMKGKAEPLPVFAVLGVQQHRAIRLQEPTYALPMIGRRREMQVLEEKLASVLKGQGQIIGITAEAGMGKSRLVAEGIRLARRRNLIGYGGACQSDGVNTPYLVWRAIWNAFFDLDPTVPLRKQIRSLESELEDRIPEQVDALPLLGAILGLSLPDNDFTRVLQPRDRKAQLETVLINCLESSAREAAEEAGGLLLVLEDLHWIDQVSIDLLELAARAVETLPILIMLTYRPPDSDPLRRTLTRLEALDNFTQIKLIELDAVETEQAIRSKLAQLYPERGDAVPPLLIERITSRAQGNPFYVEELLNYLNDRGIDPRNAAALTALDLPASLYSLILGRIDQLAASQQLSLKVASIIGRVFRFTDLHTYYPSLGTAERLKADLQELERLDLTPLETPEPELTYLFKHLVTLEVGYESIGYATRTQLHGQYARYLESTYPERIDQLAPQLAHHFERAQIQDKAWHYLSKAGEQAAASYANDEALAYFNRALNLSSAEDARAQFDTLMKRERVYDLLGKRTEQRRDLAELARLADQFDDAPVLRAQIAIRLARLEIDVGDFAAAKSSAQAAIREIEANAMTRRRAPDLLVDAILLETYVMFVTGQGAAAKPQLEDALILARDHNYLRGEYNTLTRLGFWNWHIGDYSAAADLMGQSLDLIRQAGDVRREMDLLNNLGVVANDQLKFSDALARYSQALQIARKIGDRAGEASLLTNMGKSRLDSRDFVQAGIYSEQAALIAAEVDDRTMQAIALINRGEAYLELGDYATANITTAQALTLIQSTGYRLGETIVLDNMALLEYALGNHEQAIRNGQLALTIAREIGARHNEVSALIHLGLIYTETGQLDAAEKAFSDAQEIEDELAEPIPVLALQAGLAGVALARGGNDQGDKAHACLSELLPLLLQEPPNEQSQYLPLWLYLISIRVLHARSDPRTAQLIARADSELNARSSKIADTALRRGYLNIPEHRAITAFASAQSPAAV